MAGRGGQPQVYQIDFTAVASGKRIASSKRRIRWRFGFANSQALAEGQTGTNCRGEEHDVTIIWSVTSGKRVVMMDGKEIHFSNSRNNVFEYSWTMRGNHVLKILAHASPPMSPTPGFRQYDFYVDGQSFFTFPKVFRLGLSANDPRGNGRSHGAPRAERGQRYATGTNSVRSTGSANLANIEAPHNPDEEEAYLREAIKNSLKDTGGAPSGGSVVSAPPTTNNLLLDFSAPAPAVPALPAPTPAPGMEFFGAPTAPPQQQYAALPPSTTPGQPNGYGAPVADPWGATASVGAGSYGTAPPAATYQPPAPAPAYGAPPSDPFEAQPAGYGQQPQQAPAGYGAPAANPFGAPGAGAAAANPFAAPPQQPPAQPAYGQPPPAQPETPRGAMVPSGQDFATPTTQASTLGFASPVGMPPGAPPAQPAPAPPAPAPPAPQAAPDAFAQPPPAADPFAAPVQPPAAPAADPFAAPAPPPAAPAADPFAAPVEPPGPETTPAVPAAEPAQNDPALLSMNTLSGQQQPLVSEDMTANTASGTMADQAYAKLVNMNAFDLVKGNNEQQQANPFDMGTPTTTVNNTASLADLKTQNSSNTEKKPVMSSAPENALVLSGTQQGNFGGYGAQLGMGQQPMGQQPMGGMGGMGQPMMGQQQMGGMGQPMMGQQQMGGMGQPTMGQQQMGGMGQMGQQPMGMGQMGQQPMGMGQPMGQPQYGQQPMMQQQQFGNPPPLQQQPFGQSPQSFGGF